jgi:hypothetical protein
MARTKATFRTPKTIFSKKADDLPKVNSKLSSGDDVPKVTPKSKAGKSKAKSKSKKVLKIVEDDYLELPNVRYSLKVKDIQSIFGKISKRFKLKFTDYDPTLMDGLGMFKDVIMVWTPEQVIEKFNVNNNPVKIAKILTCMREYECQNIIAPIEPIDGKVSEDHQTSQDFDEKIINTLFWLYDEERYAYLKIKIAPSAIKAAGMGAYAVDDIPEGAVAQYKGVPRTEDDSNLYYSWVVKSFDPQEGLVDESDIYLYYVDATDLDKSNWTRYVNCGMKDKFNNMEQEQVYDKIFYTTTRSIEAGEEFFIDYGPEYREYNLGMKGKY